MLCAKSIKDKIKEGDNFAIGLWARNKFGWDRPGRTIELSMPNANGGEHLMSLALREAREVFEREYLLAQISRFGGNISRTAEFVGMERSALHRKLKALGID